MAGEPSNDRHQLGRLTAQGEARDERIEDLREQARSHDARLDVVENQLKARAARAENLKGAAKAVAVFGAVGAALGLLWDRLWVILAWLVRSGEG